MKAGKSWAGYAAALWALTFATLHTVWATGWYVGLDQEMARKAFQHRWFLVYDLVVVGLCLAAAGVALALVRPWGRRLPRALVGILAWGGTAVLAIRGGAGALQTIYFFATGRRLPAVQWIWEVWFCVGAVLFWLSTRQFWRRSARSDPHQVG